jgi:PEP-CTERM motif
MHGDKPLGSYEASAQVAGANLACLSSLLDASGIGTQLPTAQDEQSALSSLDSQDVMPFLDNVLGTLGFTDVDVANLIAEIEADPPALPTDTVVDALDGEAQSFGGAAVPEPGTLTMLGSGIMVFWALIARRKRTGATPLN